MRIIIKITEWKSKRAKINKYLDLASELKKQRNMRMTLGTVSKGLERSQEELEIGGRIETIQTTLLKSAKRRAREI